MGEQARVVSSPGPQTRRYTPVHVPRREDRRLRLPDHGDSPRPTFEDAGPGSVVSEPAYSRLRSELAGRRRGGSEEPEGEGETGNEILRALRGALVHR